MKKLRAADLFCGAGGTTEGAESSGSVSVKFALNHWKTAVSTHAANFPNAKHVNSRLENTSPSECPPVDLLFASPECTHHANARGGKPTSDQQRVGAWHVLPWVEHHRPSWIVIENVVEFKNWGPVGSNGRPLKSKRGHFFDAWLMAIRAAGYSIDHQELNAADFGAATSRNRLFVICRKGSRSPIFPDPTHSRIVGGELPGMGLQKWVPAATIIDWSIECPSVFNRKRPLADNTLIRIEAGLRRFVEPFVVKFRNNCFADSFGEPLSTITAGGRHHGVAVPFMADVNHATDVRQLNGRLSDLGEPLGTICTKNGKAIVVPFQFQLIGRGAGRSRSIERPVPSILATRENHGVCVPFVSKQFGMKNGAYNPNVGIDQPLGSVTTIDHNAVVIPWISHYYKTLNQSSIVDPLDTITTTERHALCCSIMSGPDEWPNPTSAAMKSLQDTMRELGVCDVGFRMFKNSELSAAQGFRPEYKFHGGTADVTRQIGNSVSPPVARAICTAIAG